MTLVKLNRCEVFIVSLLFLDSQAKKFFGKKWRFILPATKCFIDDFLYRQNFMAAFFLPIRYVCYVINHNKNEAKNEKWITKRRRK